MLFKFSGHPTLLSTYQTRDVITKSRNIYIWKRARYLKEKVCFTSGKVFIWKGWSVPKPVNMFKPGNLFFPYSFIRVQLYVVHWRYGHWGNLKRLFITSWWAGVAWKKRLKKLKKWFFSLSHLQATHECPSTNFSSIRSSRLVGHKEHIYEYTLAEVASAAQFTCYSRDAHGILKNSNFI